MRVLICILAFLFVPVALSAQHEYPATDVENGGRLFLASCAACHGPDGNAVAGVDLSRGQFRRATSDEDLVRIIRTGIPNTGMPPNNISEVNAGNIVAYLRTIAAETRSTSAPGDPGRGRAIFEGKGSCTTLPSRQRQRVAVRPRSHRRGRTAARRRSRAIDRGPGGGGAAKPSVVPRRHARGRGRHRPAPQSRPLHRAAPRLEGTVAVLSEVGPA